MNLAQNGIIAGQHESRGKNVKLHEDGANEDQEAEVEKFFFFGFFFSNILLAKE